MASIIGCQFLELIGCLSVTFGGAPGSNVADSLDSTYLGLFTNVTSTVRSLSRPSKFPVSQSLSLPHTPGQTPPGQTLPRQTPQDSGQTPPRQTPPWIRLPAHCMLGYPPHCPLHTGIHIPCLIACWNTHPSAHCMLKHSLRGQTDTCENITFLQLLLQAVTKWDITSTDIYFVLFYLRSLFVSPNTCWACGASLHQRA